MDDTEDNTDESLSKSVSLSLSGSSQGHAESIGADTRDDSTDDGSKTEKTPNKKIKKTRIELIPPDEKLQKCEKRFSAYSKQGDTENAMTELMKLPPLARLVYGDKSWRYAEACTRLSKGYLELRRMGPQSVKHAEIAKSIILSSAHPSSVEKLSFIKCLAEVYLCLGKGLTLAGVKYKDAENALLKSWQVLKSVKDATAAIQLPTSSPDKDIFRLKKEIKVSLAEVYIMTKQIDKTVKSLNEVIKLIADRHSDEHESLIPIYNQLARAEKSRKKSEINYNTIIEHSLKAHEISSSCHKLNSVEVAETAFTLGRAYGNVDSEHCQKTAETYLNEALATYMSIAGQDDPNTIKVQDALCKVWTRTGREKEAVQKLKESIRIKADVFGECSSQVANTHKLIGGVLLSEGELVKAHKQLQMCLGIEDELYGTKHWKSKSTRDTIALIEQNPSFAKSMSSKLNGRPTFMTTIKSSA